MVEIKFSCRWRSIGEGQRFTSLVNKNFIVAWKGLLLMWQWRVLRKTSQYEEHMKRVLRKTSPWIIQSTQQKNGNQFKTKFKQRFTFFINLRASGSLGGQRTSSTSSTTGFSISLRTSVDDSIFSCRRKIRGKNYERTTRKRKKKGGGEERIKWYNWSIQGNQIEFHWWERGTETKRTVP